MSRMCLPCLSKFVETLSQPRFQQGHAVNALDKDVIATDLTAKVDQTLTRHSSAGTIKTLKLEFYNCNVKACDLDRWLQIGVTPAIEELTVQLQWEVRKKEYKFPWRLLLSTNGSRKSSIRYLNLSCCAFRPTVGLGLRSLTGLYLSDVLITGDELACLLDNAFALEQLSLERCSKIISLKIPSCLRRLRGLNVFECERLQAMEIEAQHLSKITFAAGNELAGPLSLGQALRLKTLEIFYRGAARYARLELPSRFARLESLAIFSWSETVSTPMVPSKFECLKHLRVVFAGSLSPSYDHRSLMSFLDASPSLETFFLQLGPIRANHPSIFADPSSEMRTNMPGHHHEKLKSVKIVGFSSWKSLVELTCQILESATSLEYLTLDTTEGHSRFKCSSVHKLGKCFSMDRNVILEAHKALLAIRTYIEGIVPSKVKFTVGEPCSQCHLI